MCTPFKYTFQLLLLLDQHIGKAFGVLGRLRIRDYYVMSVYFLIFQR
jgi:hypothetical protein